MAVQNISLTSPYLAEQAAIERRRKVYEALQQKALEDEPTQVVGGWAIPQSPLKGFSRIAQALAGAYGQHRLGEEHKALGERRNKAISDALNDMPRTRQETTQTPFDMASVGQDMPGEEPIAGLYNQQTNTVRPTMQDNAAWLGRLAQIDPGATAIGSTVLGMQQKQEENAETRAARMQEKLLALDAAAQNAALSREERATRAAEAAALRRDLAADADRRAREMQGIQHNFQRQMSAEMRANRPAPQPQPLVQIMGPDNTPIWVERKDAVGKTPAGAGSKAEQVIAGKSEVDSSVITLKSALDQLKEGSGITSTEQGLIPNVRAWAANTPPGQTLGSMGGTYNQKARDVISQARPLLLRSIMQATGMSARNLDSNAELKLWLSTATDPTKGYEANIEALNNIAQKYGSGGFLQQPPSTPIQRAPTDRRNVPDRRNPSAPPPPAGFVVNQP